MKRERLNIPSAIRNGDACGQLSYHSCCPVTFTVVAMLTCKLYNGLNFRGLRMRINVYVVYICVVCEHVHYCKLMNFFLFPVLMEITKQTWG